MMPSMRGWLAAASSVMILTACEAPGLSPANQKATLNLTMSSLSRLKSVSAYRSQAVTDFTPESYRLTIASITLIGEDGTHTEIFQGKEPVELADQASVEAAINANALPVEPGTYKGAQIRFSEIHEIKGTALLESGTVYTRATSEGDANTGPAEHTPIKSRGDREMVFAKPLTIAQGDNVSISLVYDLTDSVNFYSAMHPDGFRYKGGEGIELKYIPFFAFVGTPPKPEIYQVKIASTAQTSIEGDENWHYQMVLFPRDNGELAGLQCIGRIDEGFAPEHFSAINFVNNRLDAHSLNPDGSYRLVGHTEGGAYPMYEVKGFKRETHAGKVLYFNHVLGSQMPEPVELDYQATKLQ